MRPRSWLAALALAAALLALAFAAPRAARSAGSEEEEEVDVSFVKIPLRDGIHLGSVLYRPHPPQAPGAPLPVLLCFTPYTADSLHRLGMAFARRGYAFAATDVRGRGDSEGRFEPPNPDARDGHDAAVWLARQPWSNGKVAMLGHSYGGGVVWGTLKEGPEPVAAAVPIGASSLGYPWKNVLTLDILQWLFLNSGKASHSRLANDPGFLIAKFRRLYLEHLPFRQLDRLAGSPSPELRRYLDHPTAGPFWNANLPGPADLRRMSLPILEITGAYDGQASGSLVYFQRHRESAPEAARNHYLLYGPWDHPGTLEPRREYAGISTGPAAVLDMPALVAGWLDAALRGTAPPPFFQKRIAYYVFGAEEWRYAESLEAIPGRTERLYLGSAGSAGDVYHSGTLGPRAASAPPGAAADRYVYDPLDVRPGQLEREDFDSWVTDPGPALHLSGDGLVYHGAPFAEATEIAGMPRFVAWIALDVPDTDFVADLYLIAPDGGSILLGEDALRARYRTSLEREERVRPGAIERYEFAFPLHARRCPPGSRLRLLLRSPNSIFWEKNYNSGGVVAEESGRDARTAHVTLYHDAAHPSYLELPLAK